MELDWEQSWSNIPDHVLLQIYGYLKVEVIPFVYIHKWFCVFNLFLMINIFVRKSSQQVLWKSLVKRDWNVDPKIGLAPGNYLKSYCEMLYWCLFFSPGKLSWQLEYRRLWLHTPLLETEILKGHTHQVLHVSFSHNGKYFATCSKDGYILVLQKSLNKENVETKTLKLI